MQVLATGLRRLLLNEEFLESCFGKLQHRETSDEQTIPHEVLESVEQLSDCVYHVLTAESYSQFQINISS